MNDAARDDRSAAVPAATSIVRAEGLSKTYRMGKVSLEVLRDVDMQVREGEFVTLYGHSGSGKSTLLHLLGLLDRPTAGTVYYDEDVDTERLSPARRNRIRCREVGFIFQFYYLLPELTVLENTLLPAMVERSLPSWLGRRKTLRRRAADLLDELGLGDRLRHRPGELSGGERQRVAIARALINAPRLLLADEPTGNLDSRTGEKIIEVLRGFNRRQNQTILMVTHDRDLASLGRSLVLEDGRLT